MEVIKKEIQDLYNKVVFEYEKHLIGFNYEIFKMNDFERVYLVEDDFAIYLGIMNFSPSKKYIRDTIVFEELLENSIFKFNYTAFCKKFSKSGTDIRWMYYKRFHGIWNEPIRREDESRVQMEKYSTGEDISYFVESKTNYILDVLPKLNLEDRFNSWEGYLYNFIVYELSDDNQRGYYTIHTRDPNVHKVALASGDAVEGLAVSYWYYKYHQKTTFMESTEEYQKAQDILFEIMCKKIEEHKKNKWAHKAEKGHTTKHCIAENELKYFWISKHIKNMDRAKIIELEHKITTNAFRGKYNHLTRYDYLVPRNKWKSEQLVYEYTCKLYKSNNVIYQHRPYFLRSEHGQMSYDVFITKLNVAIEYQGKQHFEAVEIFGGQEHFEKQVKRDKLKKELSEKNGIKLVYINYDEDISPDLIKAKIEEVL